MQRDILGYRRVEFAGDCKRWHSENIRDLYFLRNIILDGVGAYSDLRVLWGMKLLKVQVIDEMIILNGSARNGSSLDWDDLSLDGELCQAVVKNIVNYLVA
jgi:hypothetical protein